MSYLRRRALYCARACRSDEQPVRAAVAAVTEAPLRSAAPGNPARQDGRSDPTRAAERGALLTAMIAEVDERGYAGTSVAAVLARAGLPRKALYRHFDGKEACFLAAYDEVSDVSLSRMRQALKRDGGVPDHAQAAISALFEVALEYPPGLRLGTIGIAALGAPGIERRLSVSARYERFVVEAVRMAFPDSGKVPPPLARAIVGGLRRALYDRANPTDQGELLSLVPGLVAWVSSYFPIPGATVRPRRGTRAVPLQSGRAPGTLAPHPVLLGRRGLARGDQNASRSFVVHNQRERILDAVANVCASGGYGSLSVENVVDGAAVSRDAFYEHFQDKDDAFVVAYEVGHLKGQRIVEQAFAEQKDWRAGVRAAVRALLGFLAAEPAFTRLALIETGVAGRRASDRFHVAAGGYGAILAPGFEHAGAPAPPSITVEAIIGAITEMCLHDVATGRTAHLPALEADATYVALAPFIGAQEAALYAAGRERVRSRPAP
jgi:AcrR family transcriptional regulator